MTVHSMVLEESVMGKDNVEFMEFPNRRIATQTQGFGAIHTVSYRVLYTVQEVLCMLLHPGKEHDHDYQVNHVARTI